VTGPGRIRTAADFGGGEVACDVAVVGSGAGGAVVAAELAEAGFAVAVFEEGGHHPTEAFTTDAMAMARKLYRDGGVSTTLGRPPVAFSEGRCVGGSTVVNGGMAWRAPERVIDRWRREHAMPGFTPEALVPWFERVERFLSVSTQDADSIGRDQHLMRAGAERLGWRVIDNRRAQVHCAGCNTCMFGCPTGAKQSTLVSYLPRAMRFGADVYADCRVDRVVFRGERAVGLRGHVVGDGGRSRRPFSVEAGAVVVACGGIQTPALLARSRVRSPSGRLGKGLTLHPGAQVTAVFDEPVRGWEGVHQAYQVREFEREGIILAAVNVPPALVARSLPLVGAELGAAMEAYGNMVTAGVLVEDTTEGQVRVVGGRPVPVYRMSGLDAQRLTRAVTLLAELLFAAGARRAYLPFASVPVVPGAEGLAGLRSTTVPKEAIEVITVHLMGTASMGGDPRRHVCDEFGRVHGRTALHVADASLFPGPVAVNPMETIMALATRCAARIIEDGAPATRLP
jgi:choline dehydrogenase-like flavoprotein